MVNIEHVLKPNKLKIVLSLSFFFVIFGIIYLVFEIVVLPLIPYPIYLLFLIPFLFISVIVLFISYLLGSFIDYYVQNRNFKIMIALFSGLISIAIIYIIYKMMSGPSGPSGPIICDPVHVPNQSEEYCIKLLNSVKIQKEAVVESLNRCLQNYYR